MVLKKAKKCIYSSEHMKVHNIKYGKAGGSESFADYCTALFNVALMNSISKKNIFFSNHNLVTESVFSEIHFIIGYNRAIYFNKNL